MNPFDSYMLNKVWRERAAELPRRHLKLPREFWYNTRNFSDPLCGWFHVNKVYASVTRTPRREGEPQERLVMEGVNTRWSPQAFKVASSASKTIRGCVAVMVTNALGEDSFLYSTVVPVFRKSEQEAVESLKATLPKNVGIYAVVQSSDPEAVIEKALGGMIDADEPESRADVGKIRFYNLPPDGLISFYRNAAFSLLAEQHPFTIVDERGAL